MRKTARPVSLNSTQKERQALEKKLGCSFRVTGRMRM